MKRSVSSVALATGVAALLSPTLALAAKPKVGPPPPMLFASVGTPSQLSLHDAHGKTVVRLKSGWYTLEIKDTSSTEGFSLSGPGTKKATPSHFLGAAIWGVHLLQGTYSYAAEGAKTTTRSFSVVK
jgi:hypothetical protein